MTTLSFYSGITISNYRNSYDVRITLVRTSDKIHFLILKIDVDIYTAL